MSAKKIKKIISCKLNEKRKDNTSFVIKIKYDQISKNINDFINSQLNIVRITNSKLDELKNEVLKSEYFLKYQQITYYLMSLQKSADISQSDFRKFCKKTL